MMITDDVKRMLKEIFIAMGLIVLLVLGVLCCTCGGPVAWPLVKVQVLLGFVTSALCCVFFMVHMAITYSNAVELIDPTAAQKALARSTILRYAVVLLVAFLCYLTGQVNMIAFAFGLLVLKPALYLQTVVHRVLCGPEPEPTDPPEGAYDDEEDDRLPGESHHLGPQVQDTIYKINQSAAAKKKPSSGSEKEV